MSQLAVRVSPNARESSITGWSSDEKGRPVLLVRLAAPPADGKANKELVRFLAEAFGLPKSEVTLLRGTSSRQKIIELPEEALDRIAK